MIKFRKSSFLIGLFFFNISSSLLPSDEDEKSAKEKSENSSSSSPKVKNGNIKSVINKVSNLYNNSPTLYKGGLFAGGAALLTYLMSNSNSNNLWSKTPIHQIYETGLNILKDGDSDAFKGFLDSLPQSKKAEVMAKFNSEEQAKIAHIMHARPKDKDKLVVPAIQPILNAPSTPIETPIPLVVAPPQLPFTTRLSIFCSDHPTFVKAVGLGSVALIAWKIWSYNKNLEEKIKKVKKLSSKFKFNLNAVDAPDRDSHVKVKESFKLSAWRLNQYKNKALQSKTVLFENAASIYHTDKAAVINQLIADFKHGEGIEKVYFIDDAVKKELSSGKILPPKVIYTINSQHKLHDIIFTYARRNIVLEYVEIRTFMRNNLPAYEEFLKIFLELCKVENEKVTTPSDFYLLNKEQSQSVKEKFLNYKSDNLAKYFKIEHFSKLHDAQKSAFWELMNLYTRLTALERVIEECSLDKEYFGIAELKPQSSMSGLFGGTTKTSDFDRRADLDSFLSRIAHQAEREKEEKESKLSVDQPSRR